MKRISSPLLLSIIFFIGVAGVFPHQAQAQSFDLQQTFSSITSSVQQQFRKIYLALPGEKSAEAVLEQNVLAMKNVSTVHHQTQISAQFLEGENELVSMNLSLSGPAVVDDIYQPSSVQQDLHLTAEIVMEGTTLSTDADIKMDRETVYFKANQVPSLPFLQLADLKGQWVTFSSQENALLDSEQVPEFSSDIMVAEELTSQQKEEINQAYIDFIQGSQLSAARKETFDDSKVFVVDMTFTGEDLASLVEKVNQIRGVEMEADEQQEMSAALGNLQDVTATIMIDRSTYYLRNVEIPMVFSIPDDIKSTAVANQLLPVNNFEAADVFKINLVSSFSEYNQPVEFTLPAEVLQSEDLLDEIIGKSSDIPSLEQAPVIEEDSPVELQSLSEEERNLLEQYGVQIDGL